MSETITELAKQGRWRITDVQDLGSMNGRCGICSRPIRYEYHLENLVTDHKDFVVGSKCGPTLVDASTWKAMNADYVRTQKERQSQNFTSMLRRYVALKPGHKFMDDIYRWVQTGRPLSDLQVAAVQEVFSETDWEAIEGAAADHRRVTNIIPRVMNLKTVALLQSFERFARQKPLTAKQREVLERIEKQAATPET